MKKRIFTVVAALSSLVMANAADVTTSEGLKTALAPGGDAVVRVAVGTYVLDEEVTIPAGVTVTGGWVNNFEKRVYPGEATSKEQMTILDGNALLTAVNQRHRVATVSGTLEGVVVRNGHVRTGNGGGLLIEDKGTVQNCIIKGNVAMTVGGTTESLGGGVYLNGADAKLINSVVAFNMANNGYGVAGTGQVINNTITANTYAPVAVEIAGAEYQHFMHWRVSDATAPWKPGSEPSPGDGDNSNDPFTPSMHLDPQTIKVTDFYIAQTLTTTTQYAVFAAAMDLGIMENGLYKDVYFATKFADLIDPSTKKAVTERMGFRDNPEAGVDKLFRINTTQGLMQSGIDFIYATTTNANQPMTQVSWFGSLAYCVWIGGSLPTEGQWELAARSRVGASDLDAFLYAGSNTLNDVAWHGTHGKELKEVGLLEPNGVKLYDMTGNVWEWCADYLNLTTVNVAGVYPTYTEADPLWITGTTRVHRGGGYLAHNVSLAYRSHGTALNGYDDCGFRPVLVPINND